METFSFTAFSLMEANTATWWFPAFQNRSSLKVFATSFPEFRGVFRIQRFEKAQLLLCSFFLFKKQFIIPMWLVLVFTATTAFLSCDEPAVLWSLQHAFSLQWFLSVEQGRMQTSAFLAPRLHMAQRLWRTALACSFHTWPPDLCGSNLHISCIGRLLIPTTEPLRVHSSSFF